MNDTAGSSLTEAMNRLWAKFLPQIMERIATLQKAAESAAEGSLGSVQREAATSDAHKLAGVLGTFGLQEGTELAREAESLYGVPIDNSSATSVRLAEIARQLQEIVDSRG